ncbi:MAG: glycosyltransferase [Candidatus Micrarchaeia archaeon]
MQKERIARLLIFALVILVDIASLAFSVYLISVASGLYTMVIAALFFGLSLLAATFNTIAATWYYNSLFYKVKFKEMLKAKKITHYPTVAIAVPTYNEDPKLVENTLSRLLKIDYPKSKFRVYLADDSTNSETVSELIRFSKANGINYVHRSNREGFKAGALNNLMKYSNEEFVAIFDADEYLVNKRFLIELLPYFDNPEVGYVQTDKHYAKGSLFANSIDLLNSFFFRFVQPSRAFHNTSTFAGSCGIVRRSVIDAVGGFPGVVLEDTFFSLAVKLNNFKGLYIPKTYAFGRPMEHFTAFARQQWRYNYGGTEFLAYYLKNARKEKLGIKEHMDYITHGFGLNYLSVVVVLFTILSMLIAFSNFPFEHTRLAMLLNPEYTKLYLEILVSLATVISFIGPILITRAYFKSFKAGIMVFLLNFAVTFIRAKAAIAAVLKLNPKWIKAGNNAKNSIIGALRNSVTEVAFSSMLFGLAFVALLQSNISGGVWLMWFGALYISTLFFFYKYG